MNITLTENAANHIASMLTKRGKGIGLRVGTRESGCSGYAYEVEYADDIGENDVVFESHNVKLVIDQESLKILDGMQLDYVKSGLLHEGFEFNNPNVKNMCGCGESFNV